MGAYACVWMHWGVGGIGNRKTRQRGGNYGLAGPDLGPMAGENSPNIMFCKTKAKWAKMAPTPSVPARYAILIISSTHLPQTMVGKSEFLG